MRFKYFPQLTKGGNQWVCLNIFNFYLGKKQISKSFIDMFLLNGYPLRQKCCLNLAKFYWQTNSDILVSAFLNITYAS